MFKLEIENLSERIDDIESKFEDLDADGMSSDEYEVLEAEVYKLENEINSYIDTVEGNHKLKLFKLQERILKIKRENDFYDEEGVLDMMFPNRYDDDFDEDSMSYDSVFGGD